MINHVRADALPERCAWRDTGCELHPSCLACPRPACIYDSPKPDRTQYDRAYRVARMLAGGLSYRAVAGRLGISERTVARDVKVAKAMAESWR